MGHNGPTFAIDWHPEERNWVASAGRDKMVKVHVASKLDLHYSIKIKVHLKVKLKLLHSKGSLNILGLYILFRCGMFPAR